VPVPQTQPKPEPSPKVSTKTFIIAGKIPPETWNRFGTRILPKLKTEKDCQIEIDISVTVDGNLAKIFEADIQQILKELELADKVHLK